MIIKTIEWIFCAMPLIFNSRRRVDESIETQGGFKLRNQRHGISGDTRRTALLLSSSNDAVLYHTQRRSFISTEK